MGHMEVQICMESDPMHMLPTADPQGDMGVPRFKVTLSIFGLVFKANQPTYHTYFKFLTAI